MSVTAVLGVVAAVLLVSTLAVRVSVRLGLPSLLLYLAIGLVLGESGIGIRFDDAALTQALGIAALVVILAEGGLTTRPQRRPARGVREGLRAWPMGDEAGPHRGMPAPGPWHGSWHETPSRQGAGVC